jgi:sulfate transport system ATP-binding protein/LacI family transcriptional regulator/LacI family repressor for deo operon, udp, cdd, tsx, nupC, and nupG
MLASGNYPTGIYCANDITAIGMLKCLNQKGGKLRIPSIIASDDIEEAQNTKPMLTTVRMPKEEMGRFALHLLLDRIRGGHQGVVRIELEGKLIIRSSCAKVEKLV